MYWFIASSLSKIAATLLQNFFSVQASAKLQRDLRLRLLNKIGTSDDITTAGNGELTWLISSGLNSLDAYFSKFLPELALATVITPVMLTVFFFTDTISGLVLVATLPLVPIFMILIGKITEQAQAKQITTLNQLSNHFVEILRGLTTIRIFRREKVQEEMIDQVGQEYRQRTMSVLRISFLSGFTLEILASLSVAIIAVSIGLRLLSGEITLSTGLFLLILAPEVYLPWRKVGASFHASSEGLAVSQKVFQILDSKKVQPEAPEIQPGLTLVSGPSGSGKSRLIAALREADPAKWSWLPQQINLIPGTVQENIVRENHDEKLLSKAVELAALEVPLDYKVDEKSGLSGGQQQRVMLARAIYKALTTKHLLLDEPTSAIDMHRASLIVQGIKAFSKESKIVVASHDPLFASVADQVIEVGQ